MDAKSFSWMLLVVAACLPPARPAAVDPGLHARYALGFAGTGGRIVFLERREGPSRTLSLVRLDVERGDVTATPIDDAGLAADLAGVWPTHDAVRTLVRASATGQALLAEGYRFAALAEGAELATPLGTLSLTDGAAVLTDGELRVVAEQLPPSVAPTGWRWLVDPQHRAAVLEVDYHGVPQVVSPYVLLLRPIAARLAAAVAYQAYLREQWDEAIVAWQRAAELDPTVGDHHYNLACVYSLSGRLDRAREALRQALLLGGRDFAALARTDADLEALREAGGLDALLTK